MAAVIALSLIILQRCFDESDRRKAVRQTLTAPVGGRTVGEVLAAIADGGPVGCNAHIVSGCAGRIAVECFGGPGEPYRYDVDLVRQVTRPIDDRTRTLGAVGADAGAAAEPGP